jgi:hypothetical protein
MEEPCVFQVTSEASEEVRKLIPSQLPSVQNATCQITATESSDYQGPLELVRLPELGLEEESSTGNKSKCFVVCRATFSPHFKGCF